MARRRSPALKLKHKKPKNLKLARLKVAVKKAKLPTVGRFARKALKSGQSVKQVLATKTAVVAARKANPKLSLSAARKAVAKTATKPNAKTQGGKLTGVGPGSGTPKGLRMHKGKFDESKHPRKSGRFTKK